MTEPRVTIGIPFHDEERWLGDAIRSVLAQSMPDFELLLLDDASTDRSLAIARSFDDPRITVLSDGQRRRLPARLNEIVRRARAPLVARMDADDVSHPDRLRRELAVLDAEPECQAVGTWTAWADEDGSPFGVTESAGSPLTTADALERGPIAHATMVARTEWLRANPYDEALPRAEDRDLWCRTAESSTFRVVPECLYVVRVSTHDARFLDDYRAGHADLRRVLGRYGPRAVGVGRTARLVAASLVKDVVMGAAVRAGFGERLLRRRGRPPTPEERARVAEAIAAARQRP